MGDGLALSSVLGTIAGVEEAAVDGDEGVVVFTAMRKIIVSYGLEVVVKCCTFSAILLHVSRR